MSSPDRRSELPEVILHHILSYLPIKDAARTSILSKWWNKAWETLPYLNFKDITSSSDDWEQVEKNKNLLEAVLSIVRSRRREQQQQQHNSISIEKFSLFLLPWKDEHLQMFHHPYSEFGFNTIINNVITQFLKELELINGIVTGYPNLLLPPSLLSAKWLTSLTLKGFDLISSWSSSSSPDINFTCLQKLHMEYVILDDGILETLILGSRSSLEILELEICIGLKIVHLDGGTFVKLKRLKVYLETEASMEVLVVSNAPVFEDIHVVGYTHSECYFNVKNCPNLRKVFLHCYFITENNLHQLLASSNLIEELSISCCLLLNNIYISSEISLSLKTLSISYLHNIKNLHIFSPTLKSLTFELPEHLPDFSLNGSGSGSDGGEVRVNLIMHKFDFKCLKFLENFKHIKKMTLKFQHIEIIQDYMRDELKLLSPLYGTREIFFKQGIINHSIMELVEYLLWLAPRAERISIVSYNAILLSLELVYHNEYENDEEKKIFNCSYCKLLPVDCWRHYLKEVRIQKIGESENNLLIIIIIIKYFFSKEFKNLKIVCVDNVILDSASTANKILPSGDAAKF